MGSAGGAGAGAGGLGAGAGVAAAGGLGGAAGAGGGLGGAAGAAPSAQVAVGFPIVVVVTATTRPVVLAAKFSRNDRRVVEDDADDAEPFTLERFARAYTPTNELGPVRDKVTGSSSRVRRNGSLLDLFVMFRVCLPEFFFLLGMLQRLGLGWGVVTTRFLPSLEKKNVTQRITLNWYPTHA